MRYLIVSDIHSNWEGLQAVLEHAEGGHDRILCLGDLVGYGADPNPVVDWARENVSAIIRGNHDKVCAGLDDPQWFNPVARAAALWTTPRLTAANLEYLRNLPRGPLMVDDFQILHGSPLDEDEYMINSADIGNVSSYLERQLTFFGHTHVQGGFLLTRNGAQQIGRPAPNEEQKVVDLQEDTLCLANPGAAGQPRDGDPRAAYLIYDNGERRLAYRRAAYDVRTVQTKILAAGLPELLARRLELGA